jgi:hypothetical protein
MHRHWLILMLWVRLPSWLMISPAKRVVHIDKGIFQGFMNSRQTAAVLGADPNGHYKAIDASYVPLIRMSTTVFGVGERDPHDCGSARGCDCL